LICTAANFFGIGTRQAHKEYQGILNTRGVACATTVAVEKGLSKNKRKMATTSPASRAPLSMGTVLAMLMKHPPCTNVNLKLPKHHKHFRNKVMMTVPHLGCSKN
jgi:hypothetical protein